MLYVSLSRVSPPPPPRCRPPPRQPSDQAMRPKPSRASELDYWLFGCFLRGNWKPRIHVGGGNEVPGNVVESELSANFFDVYPSPERKAAWIHGLCHFDVRRGTVCNLLESARFYLSDPLRFIGSRSVVVRIDGNTDTCESIL